MPGTSNVYPSFSRHRVECVAFHFNAGIQTFSFRAYKRSNLGSRLKMSGTTGRKIDVFRQIPRLRTRRSRSPESTVRRGLFERSEFPSHLIRYGGGGTRKRMIKTSVSGVLGPLPCSRTNLYAARAKAPAALLTDVLIILCRAGHGREWFWVLLPKQKGLVVWGRHPT